MITKDGYATVPFGDRFMVIHNGFQLEVYDTDAEAIEGIKEHRQQNKPKSPKSASKKTATPSKTTKNPRAKVKK